MPIGVNLKKLGLEDGDKGKERYFLGLVKAERQRHRENAARSQEIWACSS
jgi:hypothetical protein